jgi:hypothetical protein
MRRRGGTAYPEHADRSPRPSEALRTVRSDGVPVIETPSAAPDEAPANGSRLDVIRETIDLLEADLSAMIRGVEAAASAVHQGARSSAPALESIRERSESMTLRAKRSTQSWRQSTTTIVH